MPKAVIKKPMTLGDIPGKLAKLPTANLVYVLLLISVFAIGYLIARVQDLEKGTTTAVAGAQQGAGGETAPDPAAPDPEVALEKLKDSGHLPVKGDESAKVTMVEFSDFECPFCAKFYSETLPQIISEYVDTGKVKIDYRHYPLSFHPQAKPLAIASECANDQGKFWEMHDKIFEVNTAGDLASATDETYKEWAVELGLNSEEFNSCLDNEEHAAAVDEDFTLGSSIGVSGTPAFYINGRQLVGALPFESFKTVIEEELGK